MKTIKIIFLLALSIGATAMELPYNDPVFQEFLSRNPDFESDIFSLDDSFLPTEAEIKDLTSENEEQTMLLTADLEKEFQPFNTIDNDTIYQQYLADNPHPDLPLEKDDSKDTVKGNGEQHRMISQQCPHCDTLFATELGLKYHITQSHTEREKQCPHCDKSFATELGFNRHQTKYHPKIVDETTPCVCNVCYKVLKNATGLAIHTAMTHEELPQKNADGKLICTKRLLTGTECSKTFTQKRDLINHQCVYHRDSLNLTEAALLSDTIKNAQTSITASPAPLNEEQTMLLTADLEKEFQPSDTVENNERIYQHYLADNYSPDFQLSENSPTAQQEISNANETIIEKDDSTETVKAKEFYCNEGKCCFKPFKSQSGLYGHQSKSHPKIADETTPYVCNICSNGFKNATGLDIHKGIVHKELLQRNADGKLICTQRLLAGTDCGKTFTQKKDLINHQRVYHRDSLNLTEITSSILLRNNQPDLNVCNICSRVFKNATGLSVHKAATHEESPQKNAAGKLICTQRLLAGTECGKTFMQKRDLLNHQYVHHRDSLNLTEATLLSNTIKNAQTSTSPIPLHDGQAILLITDLEDEFQQWPDAITDDEPESKRQKTI